MFGLAITFLLVAIAAAVLGFGGIAAVATEAAQIVFVIALVLFLASLVVSIIRRGRA